MSSEENRPSDEPTSEKIRGWCIQDLQRRPPSARKSSSAGSTNDRGIGALNSWAGKICINIGWSKESWFNYSESMSSDRRFWEKTLQRWMNQRSIGWSADAMMQAKVGMVGVAERDQRLCAKKRVTGWTNTHPDRASINPTLLHFYWPLEQRLLEVVGLFIPPLTHLRLLEFRTSA
jgi:hypothetical protein